MGLDPRAFFFRPVHWPYVERRLFRETRDALASEFDPGFGGDDRLEEHLFCGLVDSRAMEFKIRCNPLESPRAVKYDRTEPRSMGARAHDGYAALLPFVLEIGPGARSPARD